METLNQTDRVAEAQPEGLDALEQESRLLPFWEIVSVLTSFLLALWVLPALARGQRIIQAVPIVLGIALMLLSFRAYGETAKEIGWRVDNFLKAARLLIIPVIGLGALALGTGWFLNSLRFEKAELWMWLLWLPLWGLAQQFVLQGFINRRAQTLCGGSGWRSVLIVAVIFAVLHLPNPWLAVATFIWGAISATIYQRVPNLLALGVAHALLALLVALAFSNTLLNSLRVGLRYYG